MRDESGACDRLSMTASLHGQTFQSCNLGGFQTVADIINRNEPSGEGFLCSRNTLQQCANEISMGTKDIVTPTVEEDRRVYHVNLVEELTNITTADEVQTSLSLPSDLVSRQLDNTYVCLPEWKN